jgi:hypothetical protein
MDEIQKEINILSACDSEYVTRYHGSYLVETKLWIIMDYGEIDMILNDPDFVLKFNIIMAFCDIYKVSAHFHNLDQVSAHFHNLDQVSAHFHNLNQVSAYFHNLIKCP